MFLSVTIFSAEILPYLVPCPTAISLTNMSLPHPSSSSSAASTSKHTLEHEAPVVSRGRELTRPPSTHVVDPSIAWEAQRRAWLAKRPRRDQAGEGTAEQEQEGEEGITTTTTTRGRRPEQTEAMSRAIILEELLDEAIRLDKLARMREDERNQMLDDQKRPGLMGVGVGVSGGSASTLTESIGGRSGEMMARSGSGGGAGGEEFKVPPTRTIEEQPDDGQTISLDGTTLSRATGAILLAFRQGRMLRDPLPLRLVVSFSFRSFDPLERAERLNMTTCLHRRSCCIGLGSRTVRSLADMFLPPPTLSLPLRLICRLRLLSLQRSTLHRAHI